MQGRRQVTKSRPRLHGYRAFAGELLKFCQDSVARGAVPWSYQKLAGSTVRACMGRGVGVPSSFPPVRNACRGAGGYRKFPASSPANLGHKRGAVAGFAPFARGHPRTTGRRPRSRRSYEDLWEICPPPGHLSQAESLMAPPNQWQECTLLPCDFRISAGVRLKGPGFSVSTT